MGKKIEMEISTIIIAVLTIIVIGLLIWVGVKDNAGTSSSAKAPAANANDRPRAADTSTALQDWLNQPAPAFTLADRNGQQYSLGGLRGKNIILFFNEGLMCYPACWNQIVAFANDERFNDAGAVVLSVVVDRPTDWQSAINKMPDLAKATVVFDTDKTVSRRFGMLTTASSMHYGSLPGHSFVLIDKEGIIKHIFDDPNMSIHNDQLITEIGKLNQK